MHCTDFEHQLDDWLDGVLNAAQAAAMKRHRDTCSGCRALAEEHSNMLSALRHLPEPEMPAGLADRLLTAPGGRPKRTPAIAAAAGLLVAAALALVLNFQNGQGNNGPAEQWVAVSVAEPRPVQLALSTPTDLENATLTLRLPENVQLRGYPNRRELRWTASLRRGSNRLELPLIATSRGDSELVLRIEHGNKSRELRIGVHANGKPLSMERSVINRKDSIS